jgi:hypothetical protein
LPPFDNRLLKTIIDMTDDSLVEKVKAQLEIEKREQSDSNGSKDQPDTEKGGQHDTEEITTSPDGRQVTEGNDGDNREARDRDDAAAVSTVSCPRVGC